MTRFPPPPPASSSSATMKTGMTGERSAEAYLVSLGYDIRGRNVRVGKGEIDLLAYDHGDGVLVFAEVKSRSRGDDDYRPDLNLTPTKRRAMASAARAWVARHSYDDGYRLDLLCVVDGLVTDHLREIAWGD